jgi:hypothetical protein
VDIGVESIKSGDFENVGMTVGIGYLSGVECEIRLLLSSSFIVVLQPQGWIKNKIKKTAKS